MLENQQTISEIIARIGGNETARKVWHMGVRLAKWEIAARESLDLDENRK
jgi:hypothetical protein